MRDKQNSHLRLSHTAQTKDPQGNWPGYLLQHDPRSALFARLNCPRRILPQAQRATKHPIQAVQDSQHQLEDGRERGKSPCGSQAQLPYGTLTRGVLSRRARRIIDRAIRASLRMSRYARAGFLDFASTDFVSTFTAFRTSRPRLQLSGLRVHGRRVHLYCFLDFASIFIAFRTSRFRVHLYCFLDFASIFTAFRTSRPSLLLFGLRVHGLRVHLYCFSDFVSIFTAFRTPCPSLLRSEFRVHGLRPSTLLLSTGLDPAFYYFPRASAQHFTTSHGPRPSTLRLYTGSGLALYRFAGSDPSSTVS
ncbi:hypothetical protein CRG98_010207 [Punica granatum]|uniref:Uncharacterized protein n=1 Tax=Punica granatum TaxID=22663 RepID=A0A2I0KLT5_PUNGR|nr:hypothetical protein CRG98_010207 [Punica granatum]